ncbi:acid protease [Mycena pura]|uniref:Acid protease n=1 Tax=Mycena pura TaxID=153505 RepID=A0AAD6VI93_9AGAR|nr:acid protease [Mycena pura]
MLPKLPASLLAFIFLGDFSCALRLNIQGRRIPAAHRRLAPRASLTGFSPLGDSADLQYSTNISVNGVPFDVLIDTGSADLWVVSGDLQGTSTGTAASVSYASGSADGPVELGSLEFAGYTVPDQAFMLVAPDAINPEGTGLMGLGPSDGSSIFEALHELKEGATVLDNIFLQNTQTPNYITFALGRVSVPGENFVGELAVGEVPSNYSDILNQPKLPVTVVSSANKANQHFQMLLDANGFIGPDGSPISVTSEVSSTSNKKQATVVIDSGFSLPQVPSAVAEAIYGRFNGAVLSTMDPNDASSANVWLMPCDQEVNITLIFGGKLYPVHPMDVTVDPKIFGMSPRENSAGQNLCMGMFQPISFDSGSNPTYDMVFGMAFLRNVVTLINFGDFVEDSTSKADPYIQLLSITNPAEAHTDFVNARLGGRDTTKDIFSFNGSTDSTVNDDDSSGDSHSGLSRTTIFIIAGSAGGVVLLAIVGALLFRKGNASRRGSYRQLNAPTQPMHQYQQTRPYNAQPYNAQPYNAQPYNARAPAAYDPPQYYSNPFEGR